MIPGSLSLSLFEGHAPLDQRQYKAGLRETKLQRESFQNGERNLAEVMELSTDFVRSVNSGYVFYPRIYVCVAPGTLLQ